MVSFIANVDDENFVANIKQEHCDFPIERFHL